MDLYDSELKLLKEIANDHGIPEKCIVERYGSYVKAPLLHFRRGYGGGMKALLILSPPHNGLFSDIKLEIRCDEPEDFPRDAQLICKIFADYFPEVCQ